MLSLQVLYALYYMLFFVKTCEVFCLTPVFVSRITYSIMYNINLLFFFVSIKFYSLLNAYTSLHNFNIVCSWEIHLHSSILSRDPGLEVQGYDLIRADHLSNVKRGGVCIYYKNHLPLKLINVNFLHEYLTIELNIKNRLCVLVALYISHLVNHTISFPVFLPT